MRKRRRTYLRMNSGLSALLLGNPDRAIKTLLVGYIVSIWVADSVQNIILDKICFPCMVCVEYTDNLKLLMSTELRCSSSLIQHGEDLL